MLKPKLTLLAAFLVSAACWADDSEAFRRPLFNGKNLDGWHVTDCVSRVEDGKLVIVDGDGFVRSDHRYRDFVLELDWRPRKAEAWDSGIYIRCELPPEGRPWPKRYQVNLLQGDEGNLIGFKNARSKDLVKPGQWNHFKLTVIGETAEMEINGQPAWQTDGIEQADGYIGIQVEAPLGGQFEFKDIFVTELDHRRLFNGRDLAGWEGGGQDAALCWKVEDGTLVCTGEKGPWLRSTEEFDDFNLRLDYKLKEGGNSGVYARVPKNGAHRDPGDGVEIQILDDAAERYKELKDYQYAGSVYAIAAAQEHVGREPGNWNSLEIDCHSHSYRVTHNGVVIVDANEEEFPDLSKRKLAGFLGLQNHSEEVRFRHIRIGPSFQPAGGATSQ
jgi:hypothetical protein